MTMQASFSELEYATKKKVTRRDRFLDEINNVTPWAALVAQIEPFYPKGTGRGRPPIGVARMLRMYIAQQCFGLSDEGIEDAIYDSQAIRQFVGVDLSRESAPDATTLLKFRRLLETHQLTERIFETINALLAAKGLILKEGTVVDATIIAAPSSTKNRSGERDPEMHQTKKGNQWHFGMKAHIGVDAETGVVHTLVTTSANVSDVTQASDSVEYLQVKVDAQAAGRAGLAVTQVQDELRAQLEGVPAGLVIEPDRRTPIVVRGDARLRGSAERFKDLQLARGDQGEIPLASLARIATTDGPVLVRRENGSRFALIQSSVSGRDLVGFVDEAREAVARDVPLPPGYRVEWGGQFENQQRAAARLGMVVPVALGLIFFVLFMTFGSVRQAALILGNVPFAMVGGVAALWLSGQYLSVPASVGFIALLGIAVLNGLVLVTHFNHLHALGLPMEQVVREGSLRRLRPVLMTASITAFGLVPLLLASGPGSEIQRPLAIVVIGGLVSSTALTLVLLPVLYRRFGQAISSQQGVHA